MYTQKNRKDICEDINSGYVWVTGLQTASIFFILFSNIARTNVLYVSIIFVNSERTEGMRYNGLERISIKCLTNRTTDCALGKELAFVGECPTQRQKCCLDAASLSLLSSTVFLPVPGITKSRQRPVSTAVP